MANAMLNSRRGNLIFRRDNVFMFYKNYNFDVLCNKLTENFFFFLFKVMSVSRMTIVIVIIKV